MVYSPIQSQLNIVSDLMGHAVLRGDIFLFRSVVEEGHTTSRTPESPVSLPGQPSQNVLHPIHVSKTIYGKQSF